MINWNDIAAAFQKANDTIDANRAANAAVIQPWQQFLLPLQISSNAPDVLMQQARDSNENYYGYIQTVTTNNINQTILYAAAGLAAVYLLMD